MQLEPVSQGRLAQKWSAPPTSPLEQTSNAYENQIKLNRLAKECIESKRNNIFPGSGIPGNCISALTTLLTIPFPAVELTSLVSKT